MAKSSRHIGEKFNHLTVIDAVFKHPNSWFIVLCDCGNTKEIRVSNVKSGKTKSCGCKKKELLSASNTTHGGSNNKLYAVYQAMKARCYNVNNKKYKRYGGRGISVCGDWLCRFESFRDWALLNGYKEGLTIERIDNDGNYIPDNCKWIPPEDQYKSKTNAKGSGIKNSKLKESDIHEIRFMIKRGYSNRDIGVLYRVSEHTIRDVRYKKNWRHVL